MRNQVRAFIAVNLSQQIRSNAAKLIRNMQSRLDSDAKWVEPQSMHVTLKFLGDIPINDLHRLVLAIEKGIEGIPAFDLEFVGCGAFPNIAMPKTIWIGCDYGAEELIRLAAGIEEALFELGYPKEKRRFSPHLTIGRMKKGDATESSAEFFTEFFKEQNDRTFGSCNIDEVVLYSSELTRRGPIYDELATVPLK